MARKKKEIKYAFDTAKYPDMYSFVRLTPNGIEVSNREIKSYAVPKRYIFNDKATILIWHDESKTIVKKSEDDEDNKLIAFLTAYFQKNSKLSKKQANDYLEKIKRGDY